MSTKRRDGYTRFKPYFFLLRDNEVVKELGGHDEYTETFARSSCKRFVSKSRAEKSKSMRSGSSALIQ